MTASEPNCPVCKAHTREEALQSDGVVLTGVEAILGQSDDLVTDVYKSLTPYDGHTAITWIAQLLLLLESLTGADAHDMLKKHRKHLNEATGHL